MRLYYINTPNTNPYKNLALEETLFWNVEKGECVLYLWQNSKTVVIGMNQNPWRECLIKELEADGGFLARRLSGGGAVFHDLGNLNFTFLVREDDYDLGRQLDVIINAVRKFGVHAEKSGRNDILADGKKFSGNAFYHSRGHSYHHGTLLVDVDMSRLSRYLTVSKEKLRSKGVDSVRSRVVNLKELAPEITIASLRRSLIESFGEVYGGVPEEWPRGRIDGEEVRKREEKFASWQWRLGRKLPFTAEYEKRFPWGDFTLQLCVEGGVIKEAKAYSDGMETGYIAGIGRALENTAFSSANVCGKLKRLSVEKAVAPDVLGDILQFMSMQNF